MKAVFAMTMVVSVASASQWCSGKTTEQGERRSQIQDDSNKAFAFTKMLNTLNPDFDFKFVLAHEMTIQNASNDKNAVFAKSTALQV